MIRGIQIILISAFITFSCRPSVGKRYAIHDFRAKLQPALERIVSSNILSHDSNRFFIDSMATDEEIEKIAQSEHPILRALGLTTMARRKSFDSFQVIMSNLDDTSMLVEDYGEWGPQVTTVADYLLNQSRWPSEEKRTETIDEVIFHHKNLKAAYQILENVQPEKKYYEHIRQLADSDKPFGYIENALFALAAYKVPADSEFLFGKIKHYFFESDETWFRIIKEFPNEKYLYLLEKYVSRKFTSNIFSYTPQVDTHTIFESAAIYKNERSAGILKNLLDIIISMRASLKTDHYKNDLLNTIWENRCPAYEPLLKPYIPYILKMEAERKSLSLELEPIEFDTLRYPIDRSIRWIKY